MSDAWSIRFEGSDAVASVATANAVLEGLRDGEWEPSDEVRGPTDTDWLAIEDHTAFAEAVAEMAPPPVEKPDDTKLDMNPLIDVALVLLIFFILTTTYSSLRRTIELPSEPEQSQGAAKKLTPQDVESQVFRVEAWMADDRPRVRINEKLVELEDVEKEMKEVVKSTGRREMMLEVDGRVPWGIEAQLHDAAKAADVKQIYRKPKKANG